MSDTTTTETGPPKQFGLSVPGWWPRVEPRTDPGDQIPEELDADQLNAIHELATSVNAQDGTRLISVMMSAEDEPRPMGVMYVNHSANAGQVMSGLLGIEATPNDIPDLQAVGRMKDTHVEMVHFDTVGAVSCVTSRRDPLDPSSTARSTLLRAYLIPQPQTLKAVLIVFLTAYHDEVRQPFAELCDEITSSFSWRW